MIPPDTFTVEPWAIAEPRLHLDLLATAGAEASLRQTLALPSGAAPAGVAVKAGGQKVYVAVQAGTVSKLDVLSVEPALALISQIPLSPQDTAPNGVAVVDAAGRVAVALRDTANASVVNAEFEIDHILGVVRGGRNCLTALSNNARPTASFCPSIRYASAVARYAA